MWTANINGRWITWPWCYQRWGLSQRSLDHRDILLINKSWMFTFTKLLGFWSRMMSGSYSDLVVEPHAWNMVWNQSSSRVGCWKSSFFFQIPTTELQDGFHHMIQPSKEDHWKKTCAWTLVKSIEIHWIFSFNFHPKLTIFIHFWQNVVWYPHWWYLPNHPLAHHFTGSLHGGFLELGGDAHSWSIWEPHGTISWKNSLGHLTFSNWSEHEKSPCTNIYTYIYIYLFIYHDISTYIIPRKKHEP